MINIREAESTFLPLALGQSVATSNHPGNTRRLSSHYLRPAAGVHNQPSFNAEHLGLISISVHASYVTANLNRPVHESGIAGRRRNRDH